MVTDTSTPSVPRTEPPPTIPAESASENTSRFTIPGDRIAKTVEQLPDRERAAIKWLAEHCVAKNLSLGEIAPLIKKRGGESYSYDSLYQALTGRRDPEQLAPLAEAIERYRKMAEENTVRLETEFIEHDLTRRIFSLCDKARARGKIGLLLGESQIGKTVTLTEYKERKEDDGSRDTIYVRMPTGGSAYALIFEMALVLHVPTEQEFMALRRSVLNCFDRRTLLIVDQAHDGQQDALMFVMEIVDRRKCGAILAGTGTLKEALMFGPHARKYRQIILRGLPPVQLPAVPSSASLDEFAEAYGLGPAPVGIVQLNATYVDERGVECKEVVKKAPAELQSEVIAQYGLGRWCMILQEARDLAKERRKPIAWGTVIAAWRSFERLSEFQLEKEGGQS